MNLKIPDTAVRKHRIGNLNTTDTAVSKQGMGNPNTPDTAVSKHRMGNLNTPDISKQGMGSIIKCFLTAGLKLAGQSVQSLFR